MTRSEWCALLALGALAWAAPVAGETATPPARWAELSVGNGMITFAVATSHALTLEIGGQGHRSRHRFEPGEAPAIAAVDADGFTLPDGVYVWQLVESPKLPSGGDRTADGPRVRGRRLSGAFSIRQGALVDPGLVEEPSGPVSPAGSEAEAEAARPATQADTDEPKHRD